MDEDSIRSVTGFIILYVLILLGSFMLVSLDNFDFITNVTAVTTCLSNVGPGPVSYTHLDVYKRQVQ